MADDHKNPNGLKQTLRLGNRPGDLDRAGNAAPGDADRKTAESPSPELPVKGGR